MLIGGKIKMDVKDIFLGGFFKKTESSKFLKKVKEISILSHEVNKKKKELDSVEFELLMESKDEVYISLADFLKITESKKTLELKDILLSFEHIDDIKQTGRSAIEVYLIPDDDNHLVICSDVKKCDKHKDFKGDPVRINTIKRI